LFTYDLYDACRSTTRLITDQHATAPAPADLGDGRQSPADQMEAEACRPTDRPTDRADCNLICRRSSVNKSCRRRSAVAAAAAAAATYARQQRGVRRAPPRGVPNHRSRALP